MPLESSEHNRSSIRQLKLKIKEGTSALSDKGIADRRLFTGDIELYAIMDHVTCLWHLQYNQGLPPPAFRQKFTSFQKLYNFAKDYFARRNVLIDQVVD